MSFRINSEAVIDFHDGIFSISQRYTNVIAHIMRKFMFLPLENQILQLKDIQILQDTFSKYPRRKDD